MCTLPLNRAFEVRSPPSSKGFWYWAATKNMKNVHCSFWSFTYGQQCALTLNTWCSRGKKHWFVSCQFLRWKYSHHGSFQSACVMFLTQSWNNSVPSHELVQLQNTTARYDDCSKFDISFINKMARDCSFPVGYNPSQLIIMKRLCKTANFPLQINNSSSLL